MIEPEPDQIDMMSVEELRTELRSSLFEIDALKRDYNYELDMLTKRLDFIKKGLHALPDLVLMGEIKNPSWSKAELWGIERDVVPSIRAFCSQLAYSDPTEYVEDKAAYPEEPVPYFTNPPLSMEQAQLAAHNAAGRWYDGSSDKPKKPVDDDPGDDSTTEGTLKALGMILKAHKEFWPLDRT